MVRRGFDLIVSAGSLGLIAYLVWHAVYGERSFSQAERLNGRIEALSAERDRVRSERLAIEKRVALLRPESVDPDMVEELARRMLGFSRPDDLILPLDDTR